MLVDESLIPVVKATTTGIYHVTMRQNHASFTRLEKQ